MCIGVRKYIGLDGMAVLTGLADDGLIDNGHPGDAVKTSRIVTGVAAHALLSMDAHEVLIGFFMICLAGELGLLVFGQIRLGILSDTERSHELRFFGDVDLINVVRTFCGQAAEKPIAARQESVNVVILVSIYFAPLCRRSAQGVPPGVFTRAFERRPDPFLPRGNPPLHLQDKLKSRDRRFRRM